MHLWNVFSLLALSDIRPHVKHPPIIFFEKKALPYFWGEETMLYLHILGGEGKNVRKVFALGGRNCLFEVKLKLHNTSIKKIFGRTNLIHFRDIWKIHILSSEKISFSMAICCKCLEHCCFSRRPFLKQLASHVSADTIIW